MMHMNLLTYQHSPRCPTSRLGGSDIGLGSSQSQTLQSQLLDKTAVQAVIFLLPLLITTRHKIFGNKMSSSINTKALLLEQVKSGTRTYGRKVKEREMGPIILFALA